MVDAYAWNLRKSTTTRDEQHPFGIFYLVLILRLSPATCTYL